MAQKGGPCCRGQPLLDNALCQAAAGLDSRALYFTIDQALLIPCKPDRHASGSPFGGNNDDRRQWRKQEVVVGAAASKTQVLFIKHKADAGSRNPALASGCETERAGPLKIKPTNKENQL